MTDDVYLITGLEPGTKYEVKARMYSNAGIGPFSELQFATTSVGKNNVVDQSKFYSRDRDEVSSLSCCFAGAKTFVQKAFHCTCRDLSHWLTN